MFGWWWLGGLAAAHVPILFPVDAEEDWCALLNEGIYPGDVVLLAPGVYHGPCEALMRMTDLPGETTIVQSEDPNDPAIFVSDVPGQAPLTIRGPRSFWLNLTVQTEAGVPGIVLEDVFFTYVRNGVFTGEGDGLVVRGASTGVQLDQNRFDGQERAIVVGCEGCGTSDVTIRNNLILGGGTGLTVQDVGDPLVIEDMIIDGPELGAVLGATAPILMQGSYVRGLAAGVVSTGPVTLARSIVGGAEVAVRADSGALTVVGSTLFGGEGGLVSGTVSLSGSAVLGATGSAGLVESVVCEDASACVGDVEGRDFYPVAGGALVGGAAKDEAWPVDFCGRPRPRAATAGAMEAAPEGVEAPGSFALDFKDRMRCAPYALVDDTGESRPPDDTGEPGVTEPLPVKNCGCAVGGGGLGWGWVPLLGGLLVRRRVAAPLGRA